MIRKEPLHKKMQRLCLVSSSLWKPSQSKGGAKAICEASFSKPFYRPSCQKATALAAATFSESTPWDMGIFTV